MKKPNHHLMLAAYCLLNGICTGQLVSLMRHIRDNGYDDDMLCPILLTLGAGMYTAKRFQDIWRQNNTKQK